MLYTNKHLISLTFGTLITTVEQVEMILLFKRPNSNINWLRLYTFRHLIFGMLNTEVQMILMLKRTNSNLITEYAFIPLKSYFMYFWYI